MITFYDSSPDIFSIDVRNLTEPLQQKIALGFQNCVFVQPPLGGENSETHAMFYAEGALSLSGQTSDTLQFTTAIAPRIQGILFFTTVFANRILEIFVGSCGNDSLYITRLISAVVNETNGYNNVWLCMSPYMTTFPEVLEFIVQEGFENPKVTQETYIGENLQSEVISLTLDKQDYIVKYDETDTALTLRRKFLDRYIPQTLSCRFFVHMPLSIAMRLKAFLDEPIEYGGLLVIQSYKLKKYSDVVVPYAVLGFAPGNTNPGEEESVMPPLGLFNFHVHPSAIYKKRNTVSNPPSDSDLVYLSANHSLHLVMHFVVTAEGLYAIQLTPEFTHYMNEIYKNNFSNQNECINDLLQNIKKILREPRLIYEANYGGIGYYLSIVNGLTIKKVIKEIGETACDWLKPDYDFLTFVCQFFPWDQITHDNGVTVLSDKVLYRNLECTPSIAADAYRIEGDLAF